MIYNYIYWLLLTGTTLNQPSMVPVLYPLACRIDDPAPGGNNNGLWESGEEVRLIVPIVNNGTDTALCSVISLTIDDTLVTITSGIDSIGDIVAKDTVEAVFQAIASISTPLDNRETLMVHLACEGLSWDYNLITYINPLPDLSLRYFRISGDGIIEPGETVNIITTLQNIGRAPAENVTSVLRGGWEYITVIDSSSDFGNISINDTANNLTDPYTIIAASYAPLGLKVPMTIYAHAGSYSDTMTFGILIGIIVPTDTGYYKALYSGGPWPEWAPVYNWYAIDTTQTVHPGTSLNLSDDQTSIVALPFTFRFYGLTYTQLSICSNGWVAMGPEASTSYVNDRLPSTSAPAKAVFGIWDDLNPGATGPGDIYIYNDIANHRFIVEWFRVEHYGGGAVTQENFEILLYDPAYYPTPTNDGEIVIQYQNTMRQTDVTLGIQNSARSVGIQYYNNGIYHELAGEVSDSFAIKYVTYPWPIADVEEMIKTHKICGKLYIYPTVTRDHVHIIYQGKKASKNLNISVFDVSGCLVKNIDTGYPSFERDLSWDGDDDQGRRVAEGVYFIKLTSDGEEDSEKIIFLE